MARTQSGHWPLKLICATLAVGFAQHAASLPTDAVVTSGTAAFAQTGNVLTVTNSNRAIINWGSFSIGRGETVRFDQATSSSVLNRVVGITVDGRRVIAPSEILGYLQSPGKVFLLNQSGTIIGAGAVIDVAGFVASSLMLSDADFLANRLRFTNIEGAGNVKNFGEIKTTSGGNVYLIAPNVENHGIIQSPNGEVILAAGKSVELLDSGTPGVKVAVSAGGEALNVGQLLAESGRVGMVGAVVRQQGTASADSIVREGGRIFLKATQSAELASGSVTSANGTQGGSVQVESDGTTLVSGSVSATGRSGSGGRVELLGDKVGVLSGAVADASGETGGGTILVGGDYQGKNPDIRNASISYLARDASLRANAGSTGDGGTIIVWSDDTTRAYGGISARGGQTTGNGGFVEVSGKRSLDFAAQVDTSAPNGTTGTLLLDPFSVLVTSGGGTAIGGSSWTESSTATTLNWGSIDSQLGSTNVTITTTDSGGAGDNIAFDTAYSYNASATSTNKLILNANDDINFANLDLKGGLDATAGGAISSGAYIVKSAGNMNLSAGTNISVTASASDAGFYVTSTGGTLSATTSSSGNLALTSSSTGKALMGTTGAGTTTISAGSINVDGTSTATADVGALDGTSSATVSMTATGNGGIALGNYSRILAGSGTASFTANAAGGASLTQQATSIINATTVSAIGNRSIALTGNSNNVTNFSGSSSLAYVSFTGNSATTHVTSASGATGVTLATTTGGNKALALGSISTTNSAVSVTASGAILDDNGSGTTNISSGTANITLTSQNGTSTAGAMAISTDVATTGTVTATSSGSYGNIALRETGANQAGSVTLNASSASLQGSIGYYRYGNLSLGAGLATSQRSTDAVSVGASGDISISGGALIGAGSSDVSVSAGGALNVTGGLLNLRGTANSVKVGGALTVGAGQSLVTDAGNPLNVTAGSIQVSGTLEGKTDLSIVSSVNVDVLSGGVIKANTGTLKFNVNELNVNQGSVLAGLGIDGVTKAGLSLGTTTTTGTMAAGNGIVKLEVGGNGISLYNGSYINSTDATQPAGGLIKLFFPGLSAGGSIIDGVTSFDSGYKVGGALTTLGTGLEVTYGILTNPVSDAIVAAMNSTSSSGGGTSETSGSLALAGTSSGTSPTTTTIDGTQTVGGTEGTFGGTETTTTTENSSTTGTTQETQNAKKKPAQCSA